MQGRKINLKPTPLMAVYLLDVPKWFSIYFYIRQVIKLFFFPAKASLWGLSPVNAIIIAFTGDF